MRVSSIALFILFTFGTYFNGSSQDYIFKKNGDEIKVKVVEILKSEVKYRKFDNLNGPIYSIDIADVFIIKYENGTRETFGQSNVSSGGSKDAGINVTEKITIPSGTTVKVEIQTEVTSKSAKEGDVLSFSTTEALFAEGKLVAPVGSPVSGRITDAEKRKALGKPGTLSISIDYLTLPNGSKVKLNADPTVKGKNKLGASIAASVVLSPLFLLKKGKDAKIEKGTVYTVYVE
ncbi:MAG: hypothetical protein FJX92_05505 [Bacteroidetes bacterium]|nr:hypothetical protein [Bacteroidota bacterium]